MEILERYKREAPDVFARLPLPKDLAEQMGCPIKDDIINLNDYLKAHLATRTAPIDEYEEKVAIEIVPDPNPPPEREPFNPLMHSKMPTINFNDLIKNIREKTSSEDQPETPPDLANSTATSETKNLLLSPQISSNPHSSPNAVPDITLSV